MSDLTGNKITMLAPCQGRFGGIEMFCLTLIEDLLKRGLVINLLRKKVPGFEEDGSIKKNEHEMLSEWPKEICNRFISKFVEPRDRQIKDSIRDSDLVHIHNPMIEGAWYARKYNKPSVMTIYNWQRKGYSPRILAWKWAVRQVDWRWYISEFVWDSWEKKRKNKSKRLPVISRMSLVETPPNQRKGFLFIGRWVQNKGIRILLDAYSQISPNPDKWPLIMIGDGPLRPEVISIIKNNRIKGVLLPGFVSENERQEYTRQAKWMVSPPHTNEDLGLTPLEARSVGVPCIATTDGGIKETAGKNALFCIPGDIESLRACMIQAINMSEKEYLKKSQLAKECLEDYVRPLDEYSAFYSELINSYSK